MYSYIFKWHDKGETHIYTENIQHTEDIKSYVLSLLNHDDINFTIHNTTKYVKYNGHDIMIEHENYVNISSVVQYVRNMNPDYNKLLRRKLENELMDEIENRIKLSEDNPLYLPIFTKNHENIEKWSVQAKEYEPIDNNWICYMVDTSQNIIIAYYVGKVWSNIQYIPYLRINIRPDYRGKGLCRPFSILTYTCLVKFYDIKVFCVQVTAEDKIHACNCYYHAFRDLGYKYYINNHLVQNSCFEYRREIPMGTFGVVDNSNIDEIIKIYQHIQNIII